MSKVKQGQIYKIHLPFKDELYTKRIVTAFVIESNQNYIRLFSIKDGAGRIFEMSPFGFLKVSENINY